jgi:YrbI family 3-deoxy-D-manno-octulosonate 8-phosphate phosphatase
MIQFDIIKKLLISVPKLLILDVDGCLTNGSIHYVNDEQNVVFSVYDGEAIIKLLEKLDILVISGRSSQNVLKRCLELGIKHENICLGIKNKGQVLQHYLDEKGSLQKQDIIAMGDQLTDLSLLPFINIFACPKNTVDLNVLKHADYVTSTYGGESAIFELYKLLEHFISKVV